MVRRILIGCLLGAAMCVAACSDGGSDALTEPTNTDSNTATFLQMSGTVYPAGTHVRAFDTSRFGTITLTLESSGGTVGYGVGVYSSGSCHSTVTRTAVAPSQLSIEADRANSYCAIVFDVANAQTAYSLRVDYP